MSFLRHINEDTGRISFQKVSPVMELPNLIELQRASYERFLDEGMEEAFQDISPIEDYTGNASLEFCGHYLKDPQLSVDECRERDATYSRPLMVKVQLVTKEDGNLKQTIKQEIFMGDFPTMTDHGTFVINGAERVVVSQLVRSPGIYYTRTIDPGTSLAKWTATIIPNRGAWLEMEVDTFKDDDEGGRIGHHVDVKIDKGRKFPVTMLLRALGYESNDDIKALFDNDTILDDTFKKDTTENTSQALVEIFKKQRPGDPPTEDAGRTMLNSLFFESKRYDLARVGSYRLAGKLGRSVTCNHCGVQQKPGATVCCDCGERINYQTVLCHEDIIAAVRYMLALMKAELFQNTGDESILNEGLRLRYDRKRETLWLAGMGNDSFEVPVKNDDIDHLGNRRIRGVGELLQNQFRVGLLRLERVVRERMTVNDQDSMTPQNLINIRPVTAAIKEFFGSSQLSQFMDQTNMLSELTHKRRLSALGPGGLSRERAGFEVRDVHYSHYGRICPIETPEGPNIGLIGSLATYGRINQFGFIESPYRQVIREVVEETTDPETGRTYKVGDLIGREERSDLALRGIKVPVRVIVTDNVEYQSADVEDQYVVAQANTKLDEKNCIVDDRVVVRDKSDTRIVEKEEVDYMDVTPKQIVSVATALIPFLEHDDANRALMGANMQRQAVPLLCPQAPIVGTGMEYRAAKDSGALVVSKHDGVATVVDAQRVVITDKDGIDHEYKLQKFKRSNSGTCINQRPAVQIHQLVKKGEVLADGASSVNGELGLGRNVLVAFMPWEGYNYEDAILLSEEMVREDIFTSIHILEYDCEARDTKLGAEEITRDIPSVGEDALKDLDENGIIRVGAEVHTEDILVGKVTPKGETELTAEERLLRAIFGDKARDVRDTSLKVPHGEKGKVIGVKVFTRADTDDLKAGVSKLVRVYVAQKRKIMQGDKMAGRHGNKGVVSRVMAVEDMPFLPDGTPVQIVLNPLGVPSRMNIGQILETHLGMAMNMLSAPGEPKYRVEVPVFDSAKEYEINELVGMSRLQSHLRLKGIYLSTEELVFILHSENLCGRLQEFINSHEGVIMTSKEIEELVRNTPEAKLVEKVKDILKDFKVETQEIVSVIKERSLEDRLGQVLFGHRRKFSVKEVAELADYIEKYVKSMPTDGKSILFDGRTGEPYDTRVTVGQIYMLKLAHLVDDKIHARSTGPYSLITQQPLGGKAQFGGQRFGEMEVWALEAYGAAYTLQELLTLKSDDVVGRVKTYEAIVKGENVPAAGIPESFKVLIKEMQSLALDVKMMGRDENGELHEIEIRSMEEQDVPRGVNRELLSMSTDMP